MAKIIGLDSFCNCGLLIILLKVKEHRPQHIGVLVFIYIIACKTEIEVISLDLMPIIFANVV